MRESHSNTKIDRATLTRARLLAGEPSQRELARRACRRLGTPNRADAMQQQLSRLERGENSWLDPETIAAIAAALGQQAVDLTEPYRWVFRNTSSRHAAERGEPIAWLSDRLPVFSDACRAYEARGWVTFGEGRVIPALEFSYPHEAFHTELLAEVGGDETRMLLDPSYPEFLAVAGVKVAA